VTNAKISSIVNRSICRSASLTCHLDVLEFKKLVDTLIEKTENYSKQVEATRLKSIGAKNMLKSAAKYREFEKQQLQSLIKEKMVELDR